MLRALTAPNSGGTVLGIVLMLAAIFLFTLMDAAVKSLSGDYPTVMMLWARFMGQLVILAVILHKRILRHVTTRYAGFHLARALTQLGAAGFFFASLPYIGLAEATAIGDINPVLITLGAAVFLGEKLGLRRIFGVIAALCGALIIIRPGMGVFSPAAVLPLCAAVCYAASALLTRWTAPRENIWTVLLASALICTVVTSIALPFVWVPVARTDLPIFALIGILGTLGQFIIIRSFAVAEASVVAPFGYVGIIFATLWGIVFFDTYPDHWTIVGALVIVAAGLYVWHRETRAARIET